MLDTNDLSRVLLTLRENDNSMTLMRLKAETGLLGTSLNETLTKSPYLFRLSENGQKIEINTDAEHGGDIEAMVEEYAASRARRRLLITLAVVGVAAVLIIGNGIGWWLSRGTV